MTHRPTCALAVSVLAALAGAALAGCGGPSDRVPTLSGLPLVRGAQIQVSKRSCNPGANSFCALQLVVSDPRYRTSGQLLRAQRRLLTRRHWTLAARPINLEDVAAAPGDKLRVTIATASNELEGVDLAWFRRARPVTLALSRDQFAHRAAISAVLQLGTG